MADTNFATLLSRLANAVLPNKEIGYEGYESSALHEILWAKRKQGAGSTMDLLYNKGWAGNAENIAALGTGDGFTVDTTINPRQSRRLQFAFTEIAVPVLINNVEAKKVSGPNALVNYMKEQLREPVQDLIQLLAYDEIAGTGSNQKIVGIDTICEYSENSSTLGGIDRDSAPALNGNVWDGSDVEGSTYNTGTLTATRGSMTLTGSGSTWVAASHSGKDIVITDSDSNQHIFQIIQRDSNTSVLINKQYDGATTAGLSYVIQSRFNDADLYGAASEFDLEKTDAVWASTLNGGEAPDLVVCNTRMFQKFVSEIGHNEQSTTKEAMMRLGITGKYTGIMYNDMVIVPDNHVTSSTIYFVPTSHLELMHVPGYGDIKLAGDQLNRVTDGTYHDASVGSLVLSLAMGTRAANRFGKLIGLNY